jgi:hypothetical protein
VLRAYCLVSLAATRATADAEQHDAGGTAVAAKTQTVGAVRTDDLPAEYRFWLAVLQQVSWMVALLLAGFLCYTVIVSSDITRFQFGTSMMSYSLSIEGEVMRGASTSASCKVCADTYPPGTTSLHRCLEKYRCE